MHIYYKYQKHTKNQNPLLNFLINYISVESAPQTLPLKDQYILRFSNFLIIGFCNSSAKSEGRWFGIISLLKLLPSNLFARVAEPFYQNICKQLKQVLIDIDHILDF